MLFDILALLSLLLVISLLKRLVNMFPSLLACMVRWKENINIQSSIRTSTDRDILAISMIIPFCLTAFRFRMYCPAWLDGMGQGGRLGATIGIFLTYIAMRAACRYFFRFHSTPSSVYKAATDSVRTYFILFVLLLMAVGSIMTVAGAPLTTVRGAMFWISGAMYLVFIVRKTQIFLSSCSFFVSFLYLCALEILPTGVLLASAVIF